MKQISDEQWAELEQFLIRVADERDQGSDTCGSFPTGNARMARNLLDRLKVEESV